MEPPNTRKLSSSCTTLKALDDAHCLGCNYPLRGLPEHVCPECGRAFNPSDPSTYRQGPWRPYWRRWVGPPRRLHIVGLVGVTALAIIDLSAPGLPGGLIAACGLEALAAAFVAAAVANYLIRVIATFHDRARGEQDGEKPQRGRAWRWAVAPVCVALLLSVLAFNWPLRARFAASRSALEAAAKQYAGTPAYTPINRWAGLFYLEYLHYSFEPNDVCFVVGDSGIDPIGFAYRPDDPWPNDRNRLAPCWYVEEW